MNFRCVHMANFCMSANRLKEPWREELRKKLLEIDRERPIDWIISTGNVVESATTANYQLAIKWYGKLISELSRFTLQDLFFTAGEKDVNRDAVIAMKEAVRFGLDVNDHELVSTMLDEAGQRDILLSGFQDFYHFIKKANRQVDFSWWAATKSAENQTVGIVGLNTNWLACSDPNKDQCVIGSTQLRFMYNALAYADHGLVAMHHGLTAIPEEERNELKEYAAKHALAVLTSSPSVGDTQLVTDQDKMVLLVGGSCLEGRDADPAFQILDYHGDSNTMTVTRRLHRGDWILDRNTYPPDGKRAFILGEVKPRTRQEKEKQVQGVIREYRQLFGCFYDTLDLNNLGSAYTRDTRRVFSAELDTFYQPLRFKHCQKPKSKRLEGADVVNLKEPVLIRGQGGTGKTTWMRYTFRQLLRMDEAFPILIEVRRISRLWRSNAEKGEEFHLIEYIEQGIRGQMKGLSEGVIDKIFSAFKGPIPVLMIDGWDEIGDFGEELRRKVFGLRITYPRLVVVVTSRPYTDVAQDVDHIPVDDNVDVYNEGEESEECKGDVAVPYEKGERDGPTPDEEDTSDVTTPDEEGQPKELELTRIQDLETEEDATPNQMFKNMLDVEFNYFEIYDIQLLTKADIEALSTRFFQCCHRKDHMAAERDFLEFLSNLQRLPETQRLAQNPLFLTMILFISRASKLPEKRHQLYEKCIDNLLTNLPSKYQDEGVLNSRNHWVPDDQEVRIRLTAEAAFALQDRYYGQMNAAFTIEFTVDDFASHISMEDDWSYARKREFTNWLVDRAGLLTDRADGTITFSHLSFQEFLAAKRLKQEVENHQERSNIILRYSRFLPWWETLHLWLALEFRDNPKRVEALCLDESLLSSSIPFWFIGSLHTELPIRSQVFYKWLDSFDSHLESTNSGFAKSCAEKWNSCKDREKYQRLVVKINECSNKFGALKTFLFEFSEIIGFELKKEKFDDSVDSYFDSQYFDLLQIAHSMVTAYGANLYNEYDLLHEVYVRFPKRGFSHRRLLFVKICRHVLNDEIRAKNAIKRGSGIDHISVDLIIDTVLEPIFHSEMQLKFDFKNFVESLGNQHFRFLILKSLGYTHEEVAQIMGVSKHAAIIKTRMARNEAMEFFNFR